MTDKIILAGNPNVGKTTLFNRLTGLRHHTGNWAGKTVGSAIGYMDFQGRKTMIVDTPGTYSLKPSSADEEAARDSICYENCDAIIIVCDGCCLERGLYLALQISERRSNTVLCVNLMDEAEKKGIHIDFTMLSEELGFPALALSASTGAGVDELVELIERNSYESSIYKKPAKSSMELKALSGEICAKVISGNSAERKVGTADYLLSHKIFAWPIMLLLLLAILWLSIKGANYPSLLLSKLFSFLGTHFHAFLIYIKMPQMLCSALVDGIYGTTAWVVSVMLPPMAIFFPLFTLLEDLGLLPRIAFNMDGVFKKCGSCGRQALCMCMGLGCNAVGVTGCRIISGHKERLLSILTNSFMPCNGRFPTLFLLAALLFPDSGSLGSSLFVMTLLMLSVILTFISSLLLSLIFPKETAATFSLELPPYRKPRICETLMRSLLDRTLHVLIRAIKAAAPAGLVIWLFANININGSNILSYLQGTLEPLGTFFGLDGAILLGFILGLPANEIVLPIVLMCYLSGTSLAEIPSVSEILVVFSKMGWTPLTIICTAVFTLFHWPCATTLSTIKKESGKLSYALAAAALPTAWGLLICLVIRLLWN